ncbi:MULTISPECIES: AMP-binding protein [Vibrio]|uniref:AMP-dependent synthetase n=2 Tax=Vibrio casei TaxID=673372 RepID=A0A368LQI9_9VIBR|nr:MULTISPECIES: AMP-binding protein [Vibrio]RCS73743.1 AMP-dependent synthetase [Vibrio casei]SJN34684.1 Long-chain-fatty-acid--CoA ligase [Vibrio casei]HBV77363.1 AMP-dependent synthetase [Vibrio sp.]
MNKINQNPISELVLPHEMILKWSQERPNDVYLTQPINREIKEFTYFDVADQALSLVSALRGLGLKPKDKIALLSKNCAEWFITDLALMLGDYVSVPIFPTAGSDTIEHCITHSEAKAIIVGKLDDDKATIEILNKFSDLISIGLPYQGVPACQHQFDELVDSHPPSEERPEHSSDTLMSIVYTSGTSGLPKGAMLTYGGFAWCASKIVEHIGLEADDRLFSYLPLAHITERVYVFGSSVLGGVPTGFAENLDTFIDDVKAHQPTLFISVPRLWTVFQQRILEKMPQRKLNILLAIPFLNNIVKKKIIAGLGLDKARVLGCGSAPISPALLHWYHSIGMNITEAWGMTETFAYSTINYPFRADKIGTVGTAGPGVDIKIASDQEIMVKGNGLFAGYYKNEEATKESFDNDGWLHTGDIGNIDDEGYLSIEGRKKDTFKTSKGKFVSPVPIEKKIFEHSRVEMMCLIGLGLPAPILLVIPHSFKNFDRKRYERKTIKIIEMINADLESHAKIKGVLMIKEPWTIENNVLTPTLKIKRHVLEKKYHDIGAAWPKDKLVVWED